MEPNLAYKRQGQDPKKGHELCQRFAIEGHGTHVASIVAGSGAKSNGKYVGVAPEAVLYIAKVLDADGNGSMSGVMAGIEWAVLDQQVQIINLSLGGSGPCDGTDALSTLCDG